MVRFVGEGLDQGRFGVEEIVGWAQDIRAVPARRFETTANFCAGLCFRTAFEKVELVEPSDHADIRGYAPARFCQIHVAAHAGRRQGLHGIRLHGSNVFQYGHHTATGMIRDALPGGVRQVDQSAIIGWQQIHQTTGAKSPWKTRRLRPIRGRRNAPRPAIS